MVKMRKIAIACLGLSGLLFLASCGKNEKELQKEANVLYDKMIESFKNFRAEEVIRYADQQLECQKRIRKEPLKTYIFIVANVHKAQAKLMQNKPEESIFCFEQAFQALHPSTPQEIFRKADLAINIAGLYYKTGQRAAYEKYTRILEQLILDFENSGKGASTEATKEQIQAFYGMVYRFKAEMSMKEKKYPEALAYLNRMMELYGGEEVFEKEKDNPGIDFQCLGLVYYNLRNYEKAKYYLLKSYGEFQKEKSFYWETMETLADIFIKTAKYEEGIIFCEQGIRDIQLQKPVQEKSKIRMLLLKQAEIYHMWGKQKKAEALKKKVLELKPDVDEMKTLEKIMRPQ